MSEIPNFWGWFIAKDTSTSCRWSDLSKDVHVDHHLVTTSWGILDLCVSMLCCFFMRSSGSCVDSDNNWKTDLPFSLDKIQLVHSNSCCCHLQHSADCSLHHNFCHQNPSLHLTTVCDSQERFHGVMKSVCLWVPGMIQSCVWHFLDWKHVWFYLSSVQYHVCFQLDVWLVKWRRDCWWHWWKALWIVFYLVKSFHAGQCLNNWCLCCSGPVIVWFN